MIDGTPQVVLLSLYLDENFVDEESITVPSVLSFQSACINGAEFDAPETNGFAANGDALFS
ncbi:MAG: hypothetical protein V7711_18705 [Pseudomonadales bacterium]